MSDPQPRWVFRHRLTVRFSDCDLLGHVNNAVYLTYFEECRVEWWKQLGGAMGTSGLGVIVAHASCNYRAPLFASDEIEVRLGVSAIGTRSVTFDYQITRAATGTLAADGRTVVVAFDYMAGRSMPLPDETRHLLSTLPELA